MNNVEKTRAEHASRGHRREAELARLSLKPYAPPHRLNDCICPSYAPDGATEGTAITLRTRSIPTSAFPHTAIP